MGCFYEAYTRREASNRITGCRRLSVSQVSSQNTWCEQKSYRAIGATVPLSRRSWPYTLSSQVGYWLNENIAVGIIADYAYNTSSNIDNSNGVYEPGNELKNQAWNLSVFGRYKLWEFRKFSLLLETPIGFGKSIQKETKEDVNTIDYFHNVIFIKTYPLISYKLTKKFDIITKCNFLEMAFYSYNSKDGNGLKGRNNFFGLNAQSTIFDSVSNITIGFTYNF